MLIGPRVCHFISKSWESNKLKGDNPLSGKFATMMVCEVNFEYICISDVNFVFLDQELSRS